MNEKELREEARKQAEKLRETQTLGVYDRDEDFEYDNGWNKGEVSGYEDGYYDGALSREKHIEELKKQLDLKEKALSKAKELLSFWVNDFYDKFNCSNKYEKRHKALVETEQFLKEDGK